MASSVQSVLFFFLIRFTEAGWRMELLLLYGLWLCWRNIPFKILNFGWICFQSFTIHIWLVCWVIALTAVDKMILVASKSSWSMNMYLMEIIMPICQVCPFLTVANILCFYKCACMRVFAGESEGFTNFNTALVCLSDLLVWLPGWYAETCPEKVLKWSDRLVILIGVAKAVHFLHTGVIPGNFNNRLKTNNILLDEHRIGKLSDYGLAVITDEIEKTEVFLTAFNINL